MTTRNNNEQSIAIIGGGACGMLTAVHMIRSATQPLKIFIINAGNEFARGVAYSSFTVSHLLNVPAAKMSAFDDAPSHFVDWLKQRSNYRNFSEDVLAQIFAPRQVYGEYLTSVWNKTLSEKKAFIEVEVIKAFATDIEYVNGQAVISLDTGASVCAQQVVLATGNNLPLDPPVKNSAFYLSKNYFNDPWKKEAVKNLKDGENVLIIGNGLTMVDTFISLFENGRPGTVYSISPHGFSILPHGYGGVSYKNFVQDIKKPYRLNEITSLFFRHQRDINELGISAEPLVNSLRSLTQEIWQELSLTEKKRFMVHLRHLWGVARHRLPLNIHTLIQSAQIENRLSILAGKLIDMKEEKGKIVVSYFNKKTHAAHDLIVGRVINCTGPGTNLLKCSNVLLKNLAVKGTIVADELGIGLRALSTGILVDRSGKELDWLYTIGGNLRGVLWESTAIPELRGQAKLIAASIVAKLYAQRA